MAPGGIEAACKTQLFRLRGGGHGGEPPVQRRSRPCSLHYRGAVELCLIAEHVGVRVGEDRLALVADELADLRPRPALRVEQRDALAAEGYARGTIRKTLAVMDAVESKRAVLWTGTATGVGLLFAATASWSRMTVGLRSDLCRLC
jgi:hypothetical protein